jgi:hypothetical protein
MAQKRIVGSQTNDQEVLRDARDARIDSYLKHLAEGSVCNAAFGDIVGRPLPRSRARCITSELARWLLIRCRDDDRPRLGVTVLPSRRLTAALPQGAQERSVE